MLKFSDFLNKNNVVIVMPDGQEVEARSSTWCIAWNVGLTSYGIKDQQELDGFIQEGW